MIHDNKEVAKNLISAMARGDAETVASLITKDFTAIATGTSKVAGTRHYQEIVDYIPGFKKISKEGIRLEFLNVTAEEDRVAVEAQGYCELVTGERYDQQYHFLFFIRDGKAYKMKEYFDGQLVDRVLAPLVLGQAT